MPFDSLPTVDDKIALYRKRREDAAALWRSVPHDEFYLAMWDCGTTACALGWLARKKHDGWDFGRDFGWNFPDHQIKDKRPVYGNYETYEGAMVYFGLGAKTAVRCFGANNHTAMFYNRLSICNYPTKDQLDAAIRMITPSDVSDKLLSLPYVL